MVSEPGLGPGTHGLWAHHASHCDTPKWVSTYAGGAPGQAWSWSGQRWPTTNTTRQRRRRRLETRCRKTPGVLRVHQYNGNVLLPRGSTVPRIVVLISCPLLPGDVRGIYPRHFGPVLQDGRANLNVILIASYDTIRRLFHPS